MKSFSIRVIFGVDERVYHFGKESVESDTENFTDVIITNRALKALLFLLKMGGIEITTRRLKES